MQIKVLCSEVKGIQSESTRKMFDIEARYFSICEPKYQELSTFKKFLFSFKKPESIEMFSKGEWLLKGNEKKEAINLRNLWHYYKAFKELSPLVTGAQLDEKIWLDESDTKGILAIRNFKNEQFDNIYA